MLGESLLCPSPAKPGVHVWQLHDTQGVMAVSERDYVSEWDYDPETSSC